MGAKTTTSLIASQAGGTIRELVERGYVRNEIKPPFTEAEWLRASSIPYICPRAYVYLHRMELPRVDAVNANLLLTFLHGTSLHWGLQNRLLPELDLLLGSWRCCLCGALYGGLSDDDKARLERLKELTRTQLLSNSVIPFAEFMQDQMRSVVPRPDSCCECGFEAEDEWSNFEYEEMWFGVPELRIGGHPDGFLKVPWREDLGLLEVKSISNNGAYKVRDRPDIKHVAQAHVYLLATGLKWACILYWAKGTFGTRSLVEHHIERDEDFLARMRGALSSLWDGVEGGPLPDRVCKSARAPRAKECAVLDTCFECEKPKKEEMPF